MSFYKLLALGLFSVALGACQSTPLPDPDPTDETYGSADSGDYDDSGFGDGSEIEYDPSQEELSTVIYFEFDSSEVRASDADIVAGHAMRLANNGGMSVRLEGHADERGSREYNIGLGERRSQAVRRMLLIQGATASQIATVSFGEERPDALGSSESAYAQNRRVEIRYTD